MEKKTITEKKINLKAVKITAIDGKVQSVDLSKEIANGIYFQTKDLGVAEKARELYKSGECKTDEAFTNAVKEFVDRAYGAVVKAAVEEVLKAS